MPIESSKLSVENQTAIQLPVPSVVTLGDQPLPASDGPFEGSPLFKAGKEEEVYLPLMVSLPMIMSEIRSEGAPERPLSK